MLLNGLGLKEEKVKFLHFIKNDEYRELGLQLSSKMRIISYLNQAHKIC